MSWKKEDLDLAISLINDDKTYGFISDIIGKTEKGVRLKLNKLGYYQYKIDLHQEIKCKTCNSTFKALISENRQYCSKSCSVILNNTKRNKNTKNKCLNCNSDIVNFGKKYCSSVCHQEFKRKAIFDRIENNDLTLTSYNYKSYLKYYYGEKCMNCGWCEVNKTTNKIPIELEHIDGNSTNNNLSNLKLLCPNCHSLTPTYKGANLGNGRYNRRVRYKNGKSF